jgi:sterol carrier protein 2
MSLARNNKVYVVGVGLTKFIKPGNPKNPDYPAMGKQAILRALHDADLPYSAIEQATASYVYGDSTCGQRVLYEVGLTGIPIYNTNNNCSSGASAIFMCHQFIKSGLHDCCLAIGFEKMEKGSLGIKFTDREAPLAPQLKKNDQWVGQNPNSPWAPQFFGNAGREHMKKYGTKESHFAKIAYKNHLHSTNNPYSQFKDFYTLNQIENSPKVYDMLTKLQCCPTSDGAGAVILASREFVLRNNLEDQAVEIVGMAMATDTASTFDDQYRSSMSLAGNFPQNFFRKFRV